MSANPITIEDTKATEILETPKPEKVDYSEKKVNIPELSLNQREVLRGGFINMAMEHRIYRHLGNEHKALLTSTCRMIKGEAIVLLDLQGKTFWQDVGSGKEKEKKQFYEFTFKWTVPGTSNKLEFKKQWKFEDFRE